MLAYWENFRTFQTSNGNNYMCYNAAMIENKDKNISIENEKPFIGMKIYYSGSIKGVPETDPDFAWNLVQFMKSGGANVLSEHVAARNQHEMDEVRAKNVGMDITEMLSLPDPWIFVRKKDIKWVDEATHVVALVNSPSHGVGMEIERAILKPERGLNETPILCLVHEQLINKISFMLRGVSKEECPKFSLRTYSSMEEAKNIINDFLISKKYFEAKK